MSGIIFVNRNGQRWRDAPKDYGLHKTLYNRWKHRVAPRWSEAPRDGLLQPGWGVTA